MKKNLLLFIAASVLLLIAALFINDGWIYSATALAAIFIVSTIRHFRLRILKITRWAKENPRKTQVLITVVQVLILSLGLLIGYDLKELGYQLNFMPVYVFGAILILGFLSTPFLPKRKTIAIPAVVNKDRMAYMSIMLSTFVIMMITGNRVEDKFPNTLLSNTLRSIDQAMFSPDNFSDNEDGSVIVTSNLSAIVNPKSSLAFASISPTEENSVVPDIHPEKESKESLKGGKKAQKLEKKIKRMMKKIEKLRKAFAAGASVGVILLVILLIAVCCAGICIALSGGGAGSVFLGLIILGLAIFGIIKLLNGPRKEKEPKQGNT